MVERQRVLADFGDFALRSEDLQEVLQEACRLVAKALGTEFAKIVEVQDDGKTALVRAGVGWAPDVVGTILLPLGGRSSETFALNQGKPVITHDIDAEDRFEFPRFMPPGRIGLISGTICRRFSTVSSSCTSTNS